MAKKIEKPNNGHGVIVDVVMIPRKRLTEKKLRALQKYIDDNYYDQEPRSA